MVFLGKIILKRPFMDLSNYPVNKQSVKWASRVSPKDLKDMDIPFICVPYLEGDLTWRNSLSNSNSEQLLLALPFK